MKRCRRLLIESFVVAELSVDFAQAKALAASALMAIQQGKLGYAIVAGARG